MTIEQMISCMDHYRRGGRVQVSNENKSDFLTCVIDPFWNWDKTAYRIHPEEQAIINHFKKGIVEFDYKDGGDGWDEVSTYPTAWNWKEYNYRIKPTEELSTDDYEESNYIKPPKPIEVPKKWEQFGFDQMETYQIKENAIIDCLNVIVERMNVRGTTKQE